MRRTVIVVTLGLLCLVAGGTGLWLWERSRRPPPARSPTERLLVGFDPGRVERVQLEMGDLRVERQRSQGVWVPETDALGTGGPVRLGQILERLAVMQAELVEEGKDRSASESAREDVARITVWRGGARPLVLRFSRLDRRTVLRTSDRAGLYAVDPELLVLIREEVAAARQAPALAIALDQVVKVSLTRKTGRLLLTRQGSRWFVDDAGALAAADPREVGRLLRMLLGLRVGQRLGQGPGVRAPGGLDPPAFSVVVDDGAPHRLDLGGPCPSDPQGRVAGLGHRGEDVVCLSGVEESLLTANFLSLRLFSLAPDEVRQASVQRERATLAVEHLPGSGGWIRTAPAAGQVDQVATSRWVADLTALRGELGTSPASAVPEGAHAVGRITLTPVAGPPEAVELFAPRRGGEVRWARREGGGRWLVLSEEARPLLGADPVTLRSLDVCRAEVDEVFGISRRFGDDHTEIALRDGGLWQLVLLKGQKRYGEARQIAVSLERYRAAHKEGSGASELAWKAPVVLAEEGDAELRERLLIQVSALRATTFVGRRAGKEQGFDRQALGLTTQYHTNCRQEDGKRRCDVGICEVELGGPGPKGACYARIPGDGAVFLLPGVTCEILRRPTVSRHVTDTPLDTVTEIVVSAGRSRNRFQRDDAGDWKRAGGEESSQGSVAHDLLFLGPLVAHRVVGYDVLDAKTPVLTATLKQLHVPPVVLRFYPGAGDDGFDVVRGDRPVRYRVQAEPVRRLLGRVTEP